MTRKAASRTTTTTKSGSDRGANARISKRIREALKGPPRVLRRDDRHGWAVHIKRVGKRYALWFPDRDGGRLSALRRAIAARDRLLGRLPPAARLKRHSVRNTTGVIDVCLVQYTTRKGRALERYSVSWTTATGERAGTSFSVVRYGHKEAFRMAVEARKQALRARLGRHANLWFTAGALLQTPDLPALIHRDRGFRRLRSQPIEM